jgi:hypothetical protein
MAPSLPIHRPTSLDKAPGLKIDLRKNLDLAPELKIDIRTNLDLAPASMRTPRTNLEMAPEVVVSINALSALSHILWKRTCTSTGGSIIQKSGKRRKNRSKRIDNPESSSAISVINASRNLSIFMIIEETTTVRNKFNWPNRTSETMSVRIVVKEPPLKMH